MVGGLVPVLLLLFGIAAVVVSRALRLCPIAGYLVLGVVLSASGLGNEAPVFAILRRGSLDTATVLRRQAGAVLARGALRPTPNDLMACYRAQLRWR